MGRWSWLVLLAACKFPDLVPRDGATNDDAPVIDAEPEDAPIDSPYTPATIQEVQASAMPEGTPVMLTDVVITAIDRYGDRKFDVFVQQPGGGEFSGIQVFGLTEDQVLGLAVRDIVTVSGVKDEFALAADTSGRTMTEIVGTLELPVSIAASGGQGTITTKILDVAALALMPQAEQDRELAKWEGTPVEISLVRTTTNVNMVSAGDPTFLQFSVPPLRVQSALAMFPSGITMGTCFTTIRGVLGYFFTYNVLPADADVIIGAGCP